MYYFSKPVNVSEECTRLISNMLFLDIDQRPTIDDLFTHNWVTSIGAMHPRCTNYIEVTDEDVKQSVTTVPKLETLIMVKQMLKRHSFKNPFHFQKKRELK